jgi:hypothetical protein
LDVNRKPKSPDFLRRFWLPSEPLAHRQNVSFGAFEPGGFRTASGSDSVLHQFDALEHYRTSTLLRKQMLLTLRADVAAS